MYEIKSSINHILSSNLYSCLLAFFFEFRFSRNHFFSLWYVFRFSIGLQLNLEAFSFYLHKQSLYVLKYFYNLILARIFDVNFVYRDVLFLIFTAQCKNVIYLIAIFLYYFFHIKVYQMTSQPGGYISSPTQHKF